MGKPQSHVNLHQLRAICMCSCCRLPAAEKYIHLMVDLVLFFPLVYHML